MNETELSIEEAIEIVKRAFKILDESPEDKFRWSEADKVISNLRNFDDGEVLSQCVFWDGNPRKYLLHLWFIRYQVLYSNNIGSTFSLFNKVREHYPDVPSWIGNIADTVANSQIDSVNDFIFLRLDDIDFDEELTEFLEDLPLNKKSAHDIIEAIKIYDIDELYTTLFDRFMSFLSEKERKEFKKKYNRTFSVPLYDFGTDE